LGNVVAVNKALYDGRGKVGLRVGGVASTLTSGGHVEVETISICRKTYTMYSEFTK
jgi:hypothetical protein